MLSLWRACAQEDCNWTRCGALSFEICLRASLDLEMKGSTTPTPGDVPTGEARFSACSQTCKSASARITAKALKTRCAASIAAETSMKIGRLARNWRGAKKQPEPH